MSRSTISFEEAQKSWKNSRQVKMTGSQQAGGSSSSGASAGGVGGSGSGTSEIGFGVLKRQADLRKERENEKKKKGVKREISFGY